ncbi:hypothetical protein [Aneurinibacillus aneurinilyticus]|jgi:hypothetical protein|uniref:hypothetical protein n=1 Tax=Aneurinibacillus aneurinilyticus TaxID=1391 RepID=UPI002E21DEE7|nr:hypothetical protein [Aneurinibacillus aneurinilyticus]
MKVKNIEFPTPLSQIPDIKDDNVDVFVELDDGFTYTLVVSTPKNLETLMERENTKYLPATSPMIIVKEITEDNIRKALDTYLENNAYWLKLYFLAGEFELDILENMLNKIKADNEKIYKK